MLTGTRARFEDGEERVFHAASRCLCSHLFFQVRREIAELRKTVQPRRPFQLMSQPLKRGHVVRIERIPQARNSAWHLLQVLHHQLLKFHIHRNHGRADCWLGRCRHIVL